MSDLIERLKQSEGPDRELDAAIAKHFDKKHGERQEVCIETRSIMHYPEIASLYTSSLDAALALVAEKLPGASVQLYWVDQVIGSVEIGIHRQTWHGRHKHPAIALLICLLRALEAEAQDG